LSSFQNPGEDRKTISLLEQRIAQLTEAWASASAASDRADEKARVARANLRAFAPGMPAAALASVRSNGAATVAGLRALTGALGEKPGLGREVRRVAAAAERSAPPAAVALAQAQAAAEAEAEWERLQAQQLQRRGPQAATTAIARA